MNMLTHALCLEIVNNDDVMFSYIVAFHPAVLLNSGKYTSTLSRCSNVVYPLNNRETFEFIFDIFEVFSTTLHLDNKIRMHESYNKNFY